MNKLLIGIAKHNYRDIFSACLVVIILLISYNQSYLLFHAIIELLSIVVAFTVFIITWNAKKVLENQYLYFVGVGYLFIGGLDLLHTLTFDGMSIVEGQKFYANQFWVATRSLEALTLTVGFYFLNQKKKINADLLFITYLVISVLIMLSILYWHIFPSCYVEGKGQTLFKIIAEYTIIATLCLAGYFLYLRKNVFDSFAYKLLAFSLVFTILSEFSFTLYFENSSVLNAVGHLFKLVSFYLIYKANVETSFTKPTTLLFNGIKESEFRYRTLANNLPVLIFRFDQDFSCTYTNTAEKATNKELLQKLLLEIENLLPKVKNLNQNTLKTDIKLLNGEEKQVYALDLLVENQQTSIREETYLVLCQDITKLKLAEEQLIELNATKDKFFSIIAHDLKNPFTTILASNELIYKSAAKLGTEKVQNFALRSYEAAKNAYALLENLLSWSMIQTGALKPKPEKIETDVLLEGVVRTMFSLASGKGIEIALSSASNHQCYADFNMVNTILRNLVSNAIKFSFVDTLITITSVQDDACIKFSVSDQGLGIDEQKIKDLLANNIIVSKDGTAKEKGTGLGLQLCKDFIYLNGGKFNIKSAVGEGATFEFWLPKFRSLEVL